MIIQDKSKETIRTINYKQENIIRDIARLYLPTGIELDITYSKGSFYKNLPKELHPKRFYDLYPSAPGTIEVDSQDLPDQNNSVSSIVFDPPFLAGYTKGKTTGIIGKRFEGFRYMKDAWEYYENTLQEIYRTLKPKGVLVMKIQDTVSSGKQYLSHVHCILIAQKMGLYCADLFVLLADNRIKGHNHGNQKHARKFHSYFLVFVKGKKVGLATF